MPDQLREMFDRPSRMIGWGVVALVHLLMWQALTHGLNWVRVLPSFEGVKVSLVPEQEVPVVPPPAPAPKLDMPVVTEFFVPTPEVSIVQESHIQVVATPVPQPVLLPELVPNPLPSETSAMRLLVVPESEIDFLGKKPVVTYPLASKRANEHGLVMLAVVVDTRGVVNQISVFRSSGYQRLDEAAVRAVKTARFRPYIHDGVAVSVEIRIPVEFS